MNNTYPSNLLDSAAAELAKLPGIGKKTALRLALHLLKQPKEEVELFSKSILSMRKNIKHCKICKNISDNEICEICSDENRDAGTICVVESIKDVLAVENTRQYKGLYHVLGGLISPMDGIGPDDIEIESLSRRIEQNRVNELILALSATPEGDTTNYFIYKKAGKFSLEISTIARGVSVGSELEYADEMTLGSSIQNRIRFQA